MIYKASYKNIFKNILLIILFSLAILLSKYHEIGRCFGIITVIVVAYMFLLILEKRTTYISIDSSNIIIRFNQFLVFNTETKEQIMGLTQSFGKEVGPKGIRRNVFRIYKGDCTVLKIIPNYNGWSLKKLQVLSNDLRKLGVNLVA